MTQLLIAGGGPAALEAALAVQRLAGDRVDITLLSDQEAFVYRPVAVTEPFGRGSAQRFSLARFAADRGLRLRLGRLRAVDAAARRVRTEDGGELAYDALLLAIGARTQEVLPGALTFGGPRDSARLRAALERLHAGEPLRVAFVAPPGTEWTLPLYELALMTVGWADEHGLAIEPWLVTHERRPLAVFGDEAADTVAGWLDDAGVRVWTGAFAEAVEDGRLWISLEGGLPVDLAVALPRPVGPHIEGVPVRRPRLRAGRRLRPRAGRAGRLCGGRHDHIAGSSRAGSRPSRPTRPRRRSPPPRAPTSSSEAYRPVLRAMLLTSGSPHYLRRAAHETGEAADEPPWWPPHKIAGRELAPYLAAHPELSKLKGPDPLSWVEQGLQLAADGEPEPLDVGLAGVEHAHAQAVERGDDEPDVEVRRRRRRSARARGRRPRAAAGPTRGAPRARRASRAARPAGGRARRRSRARP